MALLITHPAPPQAPLARRQRLLAATGFLWDSAATEHATVYVDKRTYPRPSPAAFAQLVEHDLALAAKRLTLPLPSGLAVFVVRREADTETLLGARVRGLTWGAERTILVLDNDTLAAPLRHELVHAITSAAWGQPAEPYWWISEGIAVAIDGCGGQPARAVAKRLLLQSRLPALEAVLDSLPSLPLGEGYAAAGSFADFLEARYGRATWKTLWVAGSRQLAAVTRTPLPKLEASWRAFVRESATTAPAATLDRFAGRNCT